MRKGETGRGRKYEWVVLRGQTNLDSWQGLWRVTS